MDPIWLENELDQFSEFDILVMYAKITGDRAAAGQVSIVLHELVGDTKF